MTALLDSLTWTDAQVATGSSSEGASALVNLPRANQWRAIREKIVKFQYFPDNWDGFDASAPNKSVVNLALWYLDRVLSQRFAQAPTRVALAPDGVIAIEWHSNSITLQAEISENNQVDWTEFGPGRRPYHWTEPIASEADMRGDDWYVRSQVEEGAAVSASAL